MENKEAKMESVLSVAKKTGVNYSTLLSHVKKYKDELVSMGVLKVEEKLAKDLFFVLVPPEDFIKVLKKIIRERRREGRG